MKSKRAKQIILVTAVILLLFISGCTPSKEEINKSLSVKEIEVSKFKYRPASEMFDNKPLDIEGKVSIVLNTRISKDTEVSATLLNQNGGEIFTDNYEVSENGDVCIKVKAGSNTLEAFANGNYKIVLSYEDKNGERVELNPIPIEITTGFLDINEAKTEYDQYIAKKEEGIKVENEKKEEEKKKQQEAEKPIQENTVTDRFVKVSDDGFTQVWRIYVEAGRTLSIHGNAGSKLGITVKDESGNLIDFRLVNAGQYDEYFVPSTRYNGYYTIELDYIRSYRYSWKFNVN